MTKKEFALDYAKCSLDELNGFIDARNGRASPQNFVDKAVCVMILRFYDRIASFPFLDLPGELRNRIYFELLLLTSSDRRGCTYGRRTIMRKAAGCYPQMLATFSMIRNEASSILCGANEIDIDIDMPFSVHRNDTGNHRHYLRILRLPVEHSGTNGAFGALRIWHQRWPSALLRFERVRMRLRTDTTPYGVYFGRYRSAMAHTLLSLASFLRRSTALKVFTIVGDTHEGSQLISASKLNHVLHPVVRLFANFNCKIEGFAEFPTLARDLQSLATEQQDFYKKNNLYYAMLVRDESEAYKALTEISNTKPNLRQYLKLRSRMFNIFNQPFEKQDDERELLTWADEMKEFLSRMYKEEALSTLTRASGFWLAAVKRFAKIHKERLLHFPG